MSLKVHLLVEREAGTEDSCWVVDAVDEYTMDEHNGAYPSDFSVKLDKTGDGNERRVLIVTIPDDALAQPWCVPTVTGEVDDVCHEGNCGNAPADFGLCTVHLAALPDSAFTP